MNYAGFLRPVWTWLRGDDLPTQLDRSSSACRSACRASTAPPRPPRCAPSAPACRGEATLHSWALLDSHDIARFRTVAGSRGAARARRHRPADDEPGRPDGLRRRRARARRLLGRGRPPHDAVGPPGDVGHRPARDLPPPDRAAALERRARARRHPLRARRRRTRSRTCARRRQERLLCLATRDDAPAVRLPLDALGAAALEPLYGDEATIAAGEAALPADGPAFHVWRLVDEWSVSGG